MLRILEQKYYTQTRGVTATDLKACIGEKVKIETTLYSEIVMASSSDNIIEMRPSVSKLQITLDNSDVITISDTVFVESLEVGSIIRIEDITDTGNPINSDYTVKEILNENIIRVIETLPILGAILGGDGNHEGFVYNKTPYKYFEISQAVTIGGYSSPTTEQIQTSIIISEDDLKDIVETNLVNLNGKEWQTGLLKLVGVGDGYGAQKIIKVTNEFIVTPLFLATELDDLLLGIKPDFWKKPENVKYKSEIVFAKTKQLATESNKIAFEFFGLSYN